MRTPSKYKLPRVTYMRSYWSIRLYMRPERLVKAPEAFRLIMDTLDSVPDYLQDPVFDNIILEKPFPSDLAKRAFEAKRAYIYFIAQKLDLIID